MKKALIVRFLIVIAIVMSVCVVSAPHFFQARSRTSEEAIC